MKTALPILFLLSACSVMEIKVGDKISSNSSRKVKLESEGKLVVRQLLDRSFKSCEAEKQNLKVVITEEGNKNSIKMLVTCAASKESALQAVTLKRLEPGTYTVKVGRKNSSNGYNEDAVVYAIYEDPNFNSGTDFLVEGAKELAQGQSVKDSIRYSHGNATDWIRVKGADQLVTLTFLPSNGSKEIIANLYNVSDGNQAQLMGTLFPKKSQSFRVVQDNLAVKVQAKDYQGAGDYILLRADRSGKTGKKVDIEVTDCYSVGNGQAVVLLRSTQDLKVNDKVRVAGKLSNGGYRNLGECLVESVGGGQANCTLYSKINLDFAEYKAEAQVL